ncbi:phostensin [Myotis yumanensis]|uniref:phostensin n=1 Tax=Myotis yumanensis TaxID=159337 RepID=UPI0038D1218E
MATIPDWKLQLLARRRQEEAAARGREKAERERLSQMPAWKRGLLERRRAKLGLCPGEPSPASGPPEAGPPDPDKSAVLLEAIGPVHQNRFIRQERQQQQQQRRSDELLAERRPGPAEAREWRPSPGEMQDPSPKEREPREERLSPREAGDRRPGVGGARESSPRPSEARDWPRPGEAEDRASGLPEARRWRLSPGEADGGVTPAEPGEQSPRRKEAARGRLSPVESDGQHLGPTEAPKWRPDCTESQEQSWKPLEAAEWSLSPGDGKGSSEECGSREDRRAPRAAPEELTGLPETLAREAAGRSSEGGQTSERSPSPAEGGEGDSRLPEGWKWTLHSGKAREWTARDTETQTRKPAPPEPAGKHLGPPFAEAAGEEAGAQGRPASALQSRCSGPCPLPPEDARPGGSRQQEEEAEQPRPPPAPLSPPPPAPQSPGDPLMSRLFYGVKAGPGLGPPRRSGHTFTVNPRRSAPHAAPAAPAHADAAAPGAGKKRYPTAEEISVLGGYLRLSRSCLVKGSPERHHKQLKISFSETALETTYQYPSESSVLRELGPEPEAPGAPAAQPDDEEEEEEELQAEPPGGLRSKALLVDESCRR